MAPKRRERWYSLDGQRRIHESALQTNTGPRRVISLIVLLVLVLILIQQVSDAKKVAKVAGAIGLIPVPTVNTTQSANSSQSPRNSTDGHSPSSSQDPAPNNSPSSEVQSQIEALGLVSIDPQIEQNSQVLEQLMRDLPEDVKSNLVGQVFGIVDQVKNASGSPGTTLSIESWWNQSREKLSRWIDLMDSQTPQHAALMDLQSALEQWAAQATDNRIEALPDSVQRSLQLALDRTLLEDLSDNTPWKTAERLALARLLARAEHLGTQFRESLSIDAVPTIAVPQLLSQTDTLRGRCFRFKGTIGLIDQPASMELADSRKINYSVLWLKPDDLSGQPINVYIPQGIQTEREFQVGDSVELAGLIAKRRAYASQRGGEITPVLVACLLNLDAEFQIDHKDPQTAPERVARSVSVAQSLSRIRNTQPWIPPIDRQAPLDLIQQALWRHLGEIRLSNNESPAKSALDPATLATIANLGKFQNEVDTVVSGGNNAMLTSTSASDNSDLEFQPLLSTWHGYVKNIQRLDVDSSALPGLDWREIYSLDFAAADESTTSSVLVQSIPVLWQVGQPIHQPVVIQGLGLLPKSDAGLSATKTGPKSPRLILASHVAWQTHRSTTAPQTPIDGLSPELSVGYQRLLERGWDLSQSDALERMHGQSIGGKEARPFYSMLALSSSSQSSESIPSAPKGLSVMEWIRRTEAMKLAKSDNGTLKRSVGEWIDARVQIRRIQRVDVRNPQHQTWLGTNHYYQLDGLADIGPSRIEVKYGKDFEPIAYERDFPITLVATQLPSWILSDPSTIGTAERTNQEISDPDSSSSIAWATKIRVDVSGHAYRIWRFRTPEVSAATQDTGYQQAPMMVVDHWELARGISPTDQPRPKTGTSISSVLTTLLGLAAIGWFVYRMSSASKKTGDRRGLQKHKFQ